jgi:hypothetical protein
MAQAIQAAVREQHEHGHMHARLSSKQVITFANLDDAVALSTLSLEVDGWPHRRPVVLDIHRVCVAPMRGHQTAGRDQLTERAMNVSELEGTALDLWVARAAGLPGAHIEDGICWVVPEGSDDQVGFMPSSDWEVGGRVIQDFNISIFHELDSTNRPTGFWMACIEPWAETTFWGATPLVAAMRAAVYSGFGNAVAGVCDPFNRSGGSIN